MLTGPTPDRPAWRYRLETVRRDVRRRILGHRRLLAALCAGVAVLAGLHTVEAPPPPTTEVAVASRDLPSGHRLTAADLSTVGFAPGTVPADVVADPVGRVIAGPVGRGEPVTATRLLGDGPIATHPGLTVMPARLPDAAMAALLRTGDRLDLLSVDPQGGPTTVVATGAEVIALPPYDPTAGIAGDGLTGRLVVLGVPVADVPAVADASVTHFLTFTWSH